MISTLENMVYPFVVKFNEYLSNYILVFLLVGVGIWYTIKTRFVQIRCFKEGLCRSFGKMSLFGEKNENSVSPFQALTTAIAAQVGTGNIVGASAADTEKDNLHPTIEGLRGFTRDCLEGSKEKGIIYGTGAWQVGEIKTLPAYKKAYEMGKKC